MTVPVHRYRHFYMIRSLADLTETLRNFADERDWEQFHSPKNLVMALVVEAAELAEHFQWLTQHQSSNLNDHRKQQVAEEMADVLIYLVRLADRLGIDLLEASEKKISLNAKKYPAESCRGRSDPPEPGQEPH